MKGTPGKDHIQRLGYLIDEFVVESSDVDLGKVEFQNAIIGRLELPGDVPVVPLPRFVRCHFGQVDGRIGAQDLPADKFVSCEYDAFEQASHTTSAILDLPLPLKAKVLLTVVKKLYAQSGGGRKEAALFRGLTPSGKDLVEGVLDLLRREGFAVRSRQAGETVWLPVKTGDMRRRALAMLAAPNASNDPVLTLAKV